MEVAVLVHSKIGLTVASFLGTTEDNYEENSQFYSTRDDTSAQQYFYYVNIYVRLHVSTIQVVIFKSLIEITGLQKAAHTSLVYIISSLVYIVALRDASIQIQFSSSDSLTYTLFKLTPWVINGEGLHCSTLHSVTLRLRYVSARSVQHCNGTVSGEQGSELRGLTEETNTFCL